MKKTLALILALLMLFALAACGQKAPEAPAQEAAGDLVSAAKAEGELVVYGSRSEEHTSELQSPDNISYAVFC